MSNPLVANPDGTPPRFFRARGGLYRRHPPANREQYVAEQEQVNTFHTDGRVEHEDEEGVLFATEFVGLLKRLPDPPEDVLVVGCRVGYEMEVLKRAFPTSEITGIDVAPRLVEIAQARGYGQALLQDVHDLSCFEDDTFQWSYASQVLEHCYDPERAIAEIVRVTHEGVFISVPLESLSEARASHYAMTENSLDWLALFRPHPLRLVHVSSPTSKCMNALFVKKPA